MVNYVNTIIYKLECKDKDIKGIYVGSTCGWIQRKSHHKKSCNDENHRDYENKKYRFIRSNGGWENWCMVEVERYPCENIREKRKREQYWIDLLMSSLNMVRAFNTPEDYQDNSKQYYQKNRTKILSRTKKYNKDNKKKIRILNKERREQWSDEQKEHKKDYKHNWYIANKERILKKGKEIIECDICNKEMSRGSMSRHIKNSHSKLSYN